RRVLSSRQQKCPLCGTLNRADSYTCTTCGTRLGSAHSPSPSRSQAVIYDTFQGQADLYEKSLSQTARRFAFGIVSGAGFVVVFVAALLLVPLLRGGNAQEAPPNLPADGTPT